MQYKVIKPRIPFVISLCDFCSSGAFSIHSFPFHSNSMHSCLYIQTISFSASIFFFINRSIIAYIHFVWFEFFFNFYDFRNDKFSMNEFDFTDIFITFRMILPQIIHSLSFSLALSLSACTQRFSLHIRFQFFFVIDVVFGYNGLNTCAFYCYYYFYLFRWY